MRIHHVGLVVADLDDAIGRYARAFGAVRRDVPDFSGGELRVAFLVWDNVEFEMIQPLGEAQPTMQWLRERGPGLHHLAVEAGDAEAELARLVSLGFEARDACPRRGAGQTLVAFFAPSAFAGPIVHLAQETAESAALRAAHAAARGG